MHTWGWAEPWYPQPRRDSDEATRWKQGGGCAGRAGKGPELVLGINRVRHAKGEAAKGEERRGQEEALEGGSSGGHYGYTPTSVHTLICSLQGMGLGRPLRPRVDRPGSPRDALRNLTARK